jgi:hypothetical protein
MEKDIMEDELTIEQRLANFKEAGCHVDPATAEVTCRYVRLLDPYSLGPEPKEIYPIGLEYFARSPGSDTWVWFGDIPDAIRKALWERIERQRPDEISAVDRQTGEKRTIEQWLSFFEEAGRHIDPQTAEVYFHWGYICDPYGLGFDIPEEAQCVGRLYFARAPGSDVWVSFYDLPDAIRDALWEKIGAKQLPNEECI